MKLETPELDKMAKIREQSHAAGAFLDWMINRGYIQRTKKRYGSFSMFQQALVLLSLVYNSSQPGIESLGRKRVQIIVRLV